MTDSFSVNVVKLLNSSGSLFVNPELENSTVNSWGFQRTWDVRGHHCEAVFAVLSLKSMKKSSRVLGSLKSSVLSSCRLGIQHPKAHVFIHHASPPQQMPIKPALQELVSCLNRGVWIKTGISFLKNGLV